MKSHSVYLARMKQKKARIYITENVALIVAYLPPPPPHFSFLKRKLLDLNATKLAE